METKICNKCSVEKELNEDNFYWRKENKKYDNKCIECVILYVKHLKENNRIKNQNSNKKPPFQTQKCCNCQLEKDISLFTKNILNTYGISYYCKDCESKRRKQNRKNNPKKEFLKKAKERAKECNLIFNIIEEDIILSDICLAFGTPIVFGQNKRTNNSPTLDRVDNSKGYIKGNVCVISYRANEIKNNGTLEEFEKLLNWMKTGKSLCKEYTNDKEWQKKIKTLLEPSRRMFGGYDYNLSEEYKEELLNNIPIQCSILGIQLSPNNHKYRCENSLSIDRIDPTKGYEDGNVQIISWKANRLKKDATKEEIKMIIEYIKKYSK